MTIQKYEDWMRSQVVALFDMEYATGAEQFDTLFGQFYEQEFQRTQCIRIVALDGERVAGFQSFFYWPVILGGKEIRSYQSGNSLVHPDYRGKGLFGKMLNYIHESESGFNAELLIGFPVEASYKSFMRNGWLNPFNLQWYIKPMNPLRSFFSNPESQLKRAWGERTTEDFSADNSISYVAQRVDFDRYRFGYEQGDFYRYTFELDGKKAYFELKAQRRKRIIRELVIGKFLVSHAEPDFMRKALQSLVQEVNRVANFTLISIAVNNTSEGLLHAVTTLGMKPIEKRIYFIAKGPEADRIQDWTHWWMFRSDIDTW
jgi:GNAT superfamily N-acetyltransferase